MTLPSLQVLRLAARATRQLRSGPDADALHTVALIDMIWSDSVGSSLGRSISYLQAAARLSVRPAPVYADLAAAHIVRAERSQLPKELLLAIEAASKALDYEEDHVAARFNLALALDLFGLDDAAVRAWESLLERQAPPAWTSEARGRLGRRSRPRNDLVAEPSGAEVTAWVKAAPQEARLLGWEHVLREWAEAVLAGHATRSAQRLSFAAVLGSALEQRGGDATLADAVRSIQAAALHVEQVSRLATAHQEYAEARAALRTTDYGSAEKRLRRLLDSAPPSTVLRQWAAVGHGATLIANGKLREAASAFAELETEVDGARHPALAANVSWGLSTTSLRLGAYELARNHAQDAARQFTIAGEREQAGGAYYLVFDAEVALGEGAAAYVSLHRALSLLRDHRSSVWLHNLLHLAAEEMAAEGLTTAAMYVQEEGVGVANRTGTPLYLAEALLGRARLRATAGDTAGAHADLGSAKRRIDHLEPGPIRGWMEAESQLSRALLRSSTLVALDSAVEFFGRSDVVVRLLPTLVARADARLGANDVEGALADLEHMRELLVQGEARTTSPSLRASLLDNARGVFDRLVMLRVGQNRSAAALAVLEQGRLSFSPVARRDAAPEARRWSLPPGRTAVSYALIGDTLLTWALSDDSVHFWRSSLRRPLLEQRLERVRAALELMADERAIRGDLAALYDLLLRPVDDRVSRYDELVIIADGELSAVPFAALYDARRQQYAAERAVVWFANSLRDATGATLTVTTANPTALLVADPHFPAATFPGLARLPGAVREVEAIARTYPAATLLVGPDATYAAISEAMAGSEVIHFAGHGLLDDVRPDLSFLLLAEPQDASGLIRLGAAEIQRLDLRGVRLVVLSSCQSLPSHQRRAGGFEGLAGALLGAGAAGIVGSLWRVQDEATHELMTHFHRQYRAAGDAPRALRRAQLAMLRSDDPRIRSPSAWAGFRYVGR